MKEEQKLIVSCGSNKYLFQLKDCQRLIEDDIDESEKELILDLRKLFNSGFSSSTQTLLELMLDEQKLYIAVDKVREVTNLTNYNKIAFPDFVELQIPGLFNHVYWKEQDVILEIEANRLLKWGFENG